MREELRPQDERGPLVVVGAGVTLGRLVGGGDELPHVAEEEEPHDGHGDARQTALLRALGRRRLSASAAATVVVALHVGAVGVLPQDVVVGVGRWRGSESLDDASCH